MVGLARNLRVSTQLEFIGWHDRVADLLAESQIFVLSTRTEGMPLSLVEAMRAGLPVVATNVGGIPEQVSDGISGLLVDKQNVELLSTALEQLIRDPALRKTMGIAGRRIFEAKFTFQQMYDSTVDVYRRCVDTDAGRAARSRTRRSMTSA
jgi:glycosyltransferase involved in cell wall biosynthesis